MSEMFTWYSTLMKPVWAPPAYLFGPVWTFLYLVIFTTFTYVIVKVARGQFPRALLWPLTINLLSNAAFTPLQFGLQSNLLAAIDIVIVLGSLTWLMAAVYPYARFVVYANIPYLLWVSFATVLQFTITYLNW